MIVFSFPIMTDLSRHTANLLGATLGKFECHTFPDGESKITIQTDVCDKVVWVIAQFEHVNQNIMDFILLTETCRSLGARQIKCVMPYLPYMRQDKRFHEGESISAHVFAGLISCYVDGLITVDPHCHRIKALSDIYTIPCHVLHAQSLFDHYIKAYVKNPMLIGPDKESEQWVASLAKDLSAPYFVLNKNRSGDREVTIKFPDFHPYQDKTPVVIDDIISTGKTLITVLDQLIREHFKDIHVLAVHGLFMNNAFDDLTKRKCHIITTNSVTNRAQQLDLAPLIAEGIRHEQ